MAKNEITPSLPVRIWHVFERFCSDIAYLFEPNKLFVYSWMKYRGTTMLNKNWGDDINKYFIESISNLKVKDLTLSIFYKIFPPTGYRCIGSIIGAFKAKKYEVWGSGITDGERSIPLLPKKVYSVRGPLTRQTLIKGGLKFMMTLHF